MSFARNLQMSQRQSIPQKVKVAKRKKSRDYYSNSKNYNQLSMHKEITINWVEN